MKNLKPRLRQGGFLLASLLFAGAMIGPSAMAAGTINEYSLGGGGSSPFGITAGPDGNIWIAERSGSIAKMSTSGTLLATYPVAGGSSEPFGITAGPDGNLWFTDSANNAIGKITTSGVVTEFTSGISASALPTGITAGADGNLWFTEDGITNKVGKITTSGVVTEFSLGFGFPGQGITKGADGNVWFVDESGSIDQITPSGTITPFSTGSDAPTTVVAGPDGNLWYNSWNHSIIGKMDLSGNITHYSTPHNTNVYDMAAGPDGNVWFSLPFFDSIARITPSGVVTEFATPTSGSGPAGLTAGPDGNLWFSEQGTDLIGEFVIVDPVTPAGSGASSTITASSSINAPDTGFGAPTRLTPLAAAIISGGILSSASGLLLLYRLKVRFDHIPGNNFDIG